MKQLYSVVGGCLSAALLAACGASNGLSSPLQTSVSPQIGAPLIKSSVLVAKRAHTAPAYSVVYSFKGGPGDGANPYAALLNVNGTEYGTTGGGGASGKGTAFAITTSGGETVLYSFKGKNGYGPSGLLNVNGTLYGTTNSGGANKDGTVFAITTSGAETVLHSFGGGSDGAYPVAGLINANGTLYGTTAQGGDGTGCSKHLNCGTVFAITTSGAETVLYRFGGGKDGAYPYAGLIKVNGTLYGTTFEGGAHGRGTVFSITTSGMETVLHSFKDVLGRDGAYPSAGLINVKGTLYGTTYWGGSGCANGAGCGTVFAITPSGTETVLHIFGGGSGDGAYPSAGLINVKGTLYGTTSEGGGSGCVNGAGCGTVFAITTSGKETLLYSFAGEPDGALPAAALLNVDDMLYGTTNSGGANDDGTVFSLSP